MKGIIVLLAIVLVCPGLVLAEPCTGVTSATISNHDTYAFCWDPNPETDQVVYYNIYMNGTLFDSLSSVVCDWERCDTGLYPKLGRGEYVFTITAENIDGYESIQSDPVNITVVNVAPGQVKNLNKK